ncbi:hypothetical protein F4553_005650 [Allocatelliglobosispora scoriae]|uniref:Pyrrolo-quinoline quinone repeat domain-containing protein n=1 Tax=Allocatelliglobosispora scoriae TaxID=643052 RepID=A0A841BXG8_9ACTN|nr:PQQ-binding-like beta-propeller repeat protein [Allocatelliglobosispora scoriae]MBB5872216.1 hypothetical protein [Allocatelliglobosispora scoriae]
MTADLDPFFAALRQDADAVPTGVPAVARRRGRSRTLRTVAGAAAGVLVLVGGVGVAVRGGSGSDPDIAPQPVASHSVPGPVIPFGSLRQVGEAVTVDGPTRVTTIPTTADRAFVGRQTEDDGKLTVTAINLSNGRVAWGPKTIGTFGDAAFVSWHPRYVIASGRHDAGVRPDGSVTVLDQKNGKVLMRVDVNNFEEDHVIIGESLMIIDSRLDRTIRAYDLATGKVQWSLPDGGNPTVHLMADSSTAAMGDVNSNRGRFSPGADFGFTRIVQVTTDGTAIVRNARTSAEVSRHPKAADPAGQDAHDEMLTIDGVLYTSRINATAVIRATDLRPGGATRQLYTNDAASAHSLTPCGTGRLCFTEFAEGDRSGKYGLTSISTTDGKVAWRRNVESRDLRTVNGLLLVSISPGQSDMVSTVTDSDGREVLSAEGRRGDAYWLDTNALIIFRGFGKNGYEVFATSPIAADPVLLGEVDGVGECGWNTTHLICVASGQIKVWGFTK